MVSSCCLVLSAKVVHDFRSNHVVGELLIATHMENLEISRLITVGQPRPGPNGGMKSYVSVDA